MDKTKYRRCPSCRYRAEHHYSKSDEFDFKSYPSGRYQGTYVSIISYIVTLAWHAKGFSDIRELGTKIYYDWKIGGSKNDTAVMVLQGSNDTNNEILKIASVATHRNPSLFMPTQWYSIR